MSNFDLKNLNIGIVGLGYVGLPLAVEFGRQYPTVGFDINAARVAELEGGGLRNEGSGRITRTGSNSPSLRGRSSSTMRRRT